MIPFAKNRKERTNWLFAAFYTIGLAWQLLFLDTNHSKYAKYVLLGATVLLIGVHVYSAISNRKKGIDLGA